MPTDNFEDDPDVQEAMKVIKAAFEKVLEKKVAPVCRQSARAELLRWFSSPSWPSPQQERVRNLFVEVGMLSWGFGSPRKAYELLKAALDCDIDWLYEQHGTGPANLFWLEWATRHDKIKGWSTEQERLENGELRLSFDLKHPVKWIKGTFEVEAGEGALNPEIDDG